MTLSWLRRRDAWGGKGWPDHTAGRDEAAAGGQLRSKATSPGCRRPPRSARDGTALGGPVHRLRFKGQTGRPRVFAPRLRCPPPARLQPGPAAPPVPPTSRRAGTLQLSPDRGAFLVPRLCFLFSAFVLPSLVLCSSLSFVPMPLVSLPFDALSLPSSWCFSFPGFLSWRLFSLAALCLAFSSFLLPGPLLGSHGPGPDCLQTPFVLFWCLDFPAFMSFLKRLLAISSPQ